MHPNHNSKRRRLGAQLAPEVLESRELMTGGAGDTFAIVRGEITKPGQPAAVKFTINPTSFTMPKGGMTLGIDVAPTSDSTVKPMIRSVSGAGGRLVAETFHAKYDPHLKQTQPAPGGVTSAVLTQVKLDPKHPTAPVTYTVNVTNTTTATGKFLLGFYLPGDANGDGVVNQADVAIVKTALGSQANDTKYNFEADVNRDGRINGTDLKYTLMNLGAKTVVTPVVSANLDPGANVGLQGRVTSQKVVTFTGTATPGAAVVFAETQNKTGPVSTKADATGNYKLNVPLGSGQNTFQVTTADSFGQSISGTINPVTHLDSSQVVSAANIDALKQQANVSVPKA